MRSMTNRLGMGPWFAGRWLTAALVPFVAAACGGNAAPPVDENADRDLAGGARSPTPSATVGEDASEAPVDEGPVVSVGEPSDVDVDLPPPGPPVYECPWERRGAMPEGRVGMGFAELDDRVYLFGGLSKEQFEQGPGADDLTLSSLNVYDPATDDWSQRGPMPIDSGDVSAVTVGDFMYVFAGIGTGGFISRGYRYDAEADSWLERAPMRVNRTNFETVAVGSKVYLIGGSGQADDGPGTSGEWLSKSGLEIYDTLTDSWSSGAPAPGAINDGSSCALGSRIYVFDGTVSGATYIYDTTTNTWSEGARAPEARSLASCVARGDSVLLMGGRPPLSYESDPEPTGPGEIAGTIESSIVVQAYFPELDSWSGARDMLRAREQFVAVPIAEDVYVIGGAESHTKEGPYGTFVLDEVTAMTDTFCEVR